MAENEKQLLDALAVLPKEVKTNFVEHLQTAANVVRIMEEMQKDKQETAEEVRK